MHTNLPYKDNREKELQYKSTSQVAKSLPPITGLTSFRKNSRTPWDVSALEGIKITSSLSALRAKAKRELALSK